MKTTYLTKKMVWLVCWMIVSGAGYGAVYISDNFNSYTDYGQPSNPPWNVSATPTNQINRVDPDMGNYFGEGTSNKFLRMRQQSGSGSTLARGIRNYATGASAVSVRFDFYDMSNDAAATGVQFYLGGTGWATNYWQRLTFRGGSIRNFNESTWWSYTMGAKHTLEIVANGGNQTVFYGMDGSESVAPNTFDLWLDGAKIADDFAKELSNLASPGDFQCFEFQIPAFTTGGSREFYFDNFEVRSLSFGPSRADLSGPVYGQPDSCVNIYDLTYLAEEWLDSTVPDLATLTGDGNLKTIARIVNGSIVVDGNLSEWSNAEWITLDKVYYGSPLLNSAKCAVYWARNVDNNAAAGGKLYVAVEVDDPDIVLSDDNYAWNDSDRIELYIKGNTAASGNYQAAQDVAQQYVVGIKASDNTQCWITMGNSAPLPTGSGFQCAVSRTGSILRYEAVIPIYDYYGYFTSQPDQITSVFGGKKIGFDVVVDDKRTNAFGMVSENLMLNKSTNAASLAFYTLDSGCVKSDINQDFYVDLSDFSYLALDWLKCN